MDIKSVPSAASASQSRKWTWKEIVVGLVSLATIVLWFLIPYLPWLGNEGLVALIPLCVFFGINLVPRSAVTELPWNMILLVMGGGALGEAIKGSSLLQLIAKLFGGGFASLNFFVKLLILTFIVAFVSIFVSHTVAAIVLIPIVNSVMAGSDKHIELMV